MESEVKSLKQTWVSQAKILWRGIVKDKFLYILMIPGILWFVVFRYVPMYGASIAFRDYNIYQGFENAPWAGFKYFIQLFSLPMFKTAFSNTVTLSVMKLVLGFPAPIIMALMINSVRNTRYKKLIQTSVILPHFVSWVIVSSIMLQLLSPSNGAIVEIAELLGYEGKINNIFVDRAHFKWFLVLSDIWKEAGYGTIVYLGALTAVDPQLYEAATVDGANAWRKTWHVTLPGIRLTIIILFIFRMGAIMNVGFEQIFILSNAVVVDVAEVIDTYVYKLGMTNRQYSLSTAAGLFKSLIGLVLVLFANYTANKIEPGSGIM